MTWVTLLTLLLKVVSTITDYVDKKQLLDAGESKAIREQSDLLLKRVEKAQRLRRNVDPDREL